jgi:1,4-alpha-glucan branching enzyme
MIYKMPGDEWQKFANLRLLYTYMFAHPGAKLLFMGNEFAQTNEWNYKTSLRWDLLEHPSHAGMKACVSALAHLLKQEPALHEQQFNHEGFAWHDLDHREESVICFKRMTKDTDQELMVVLNMTPRERLDWTVSVNSSAQWTEIFNSDEKKYWGTGNYVNNTVISPINQKNTNLHEIKISLPPLGGCILKRINPNLNLPQ